MQKLNSSFDVAIVGAGPVGGIIACALKALNRNLKIVVYEKRIEKTRNHGLYLAPDAIDRIVSLFETTISNKEKSSRAHEDAVRDLVKQFKEWRKKNVQTSQIENVVVNMAKRIGVIFREGETFEVSPNFISLDQVIKETRAKVVIGADGARSEVRKAIGAIQTEIVPLSYLLEFKAKVLGDFQRLTSGQLTTGVARSEGFDFETVARTKAGAQVALHRFISKATHETLLRGGMGTQASPWSLKSLKELGEKDEEIKQISDYINDYLDDHNAIGKVEQERIVTFPMTLYRSDIMAKRYNGAVVAVAGDAAAGFVLARGANAGIIEASMLVTHTLDYLDQISDSAAKHKESGELPKQFVQYQNEVISLYRSEKRWAQFKNFCLNAGEFLVKCLVKPFKWLYAGLSFVLRLFR